MATTTHLNPRYVRATGVASVEAVVFLPFLLLLFFSVTFVHQRYDAAQRAWANARSCAWLYSQHACEGQLPAECAAQSAVPENAAEDSALTDSLSDIDSSNNDDLGPKLQNTMAQREHSLFGEYTNVSGSMMFEPPTMFGGERTSSATYYLPCNLKPQTLSGIIGDFIGTIL